MADPFLGEIRLCSFNFPPKGWAMCNGQMLPINQNMALFSLMGTMYGGNGQTNFGLPDLRGRVPIHVGSGFTQGQRAGEQYHTLSVTETPSHTHAEAAIASGATNAGPAGALPARAASAVYGDPTALTAMEQSAVSTVGGSQPHENRQPFLALNFCVALQGIFPSQF